jgi:predicted RNA binding protein YcfA (HicA-like mRNA interferase family)
MKTRQALKLFAKLGVTIHPPESGGSHYNLSFNGRRTQFPHHSEDYGPVYIRKILKSLGIDPAGVI